MDPVVARLVGRLDADLKELFDERSAIREYDGLQCRPLAEAMGLIDVISLRTKDAFACWM